MTIEQYLTFKLAVECGNFAKVADKLEISPAAVGKQIKVLESTVGAQLFHRTTRKITLTEFGQVFYEQVCRVLEAYEDSEQLVAAYGGRARGKLKILTSVYLSERFILPHLSDFMSQYPDVVLDFEFAERIPNLDKEDLDLAIGLMVQYIPEQFVSRRIMEDRYICVASPKYLKKYGTPEHPDDLASHRIITHSKRPTPTVLALKGASVAVKPVLWLNNIMAMTACCREGLGIAILPESAVTFSNARKSELVPLLSKFMQPPTSVVLYYKKTLYVQPKLRAFIDFIVPKFQ